LQRRVLSRSKAKMIAEEASHLLGIFAVEVNSVQISPTGKDAKNLCIDECFQGLG
jgi:hypothetical protein